MIRQDQASPFILFSYQSLRTDNPSGFKTDLRLIIDLEAVVGNILQKLCGNTCACPSVPLQNCVIILLFFCIH